MNLKKFVQVFLALFVIFFTNASFGEDMRLAGFQGKAPVKTVHNNISKQLLPFRLCATEP